MHSLAEFYDLILMRKWLGTIQFTNNEIVHSADTLVEDLECLHAYFLGEGLKHSDRVILNASSSINSILSFIVLWKMGVVVIPIKPGQNYSSIVNDSRAHFFIDPDSKECNELKLESRESSKFYFTSERVVTGVDLALIIYTSGSTGTAKGIMLSHNNVISALDAITDYLSINSTDRILSTSPLSFDYGLYQLIFCLYKNAHMIVYQGMMQPVKLVKVIDQFGITILPVVPATAIIFEKGLSVTTGDISNLRLITNTGGHLMQRCIDTYLSKLPYVNIVPMYGLTESKRVLYLPPDKIALKMGSVGIPMPGIEAKLFRREKLANKEIFKEVAYGEIGELFVRGESVMQGYVTSNGSGSKLYDGSYREDNWLSTGDLFSQDEDGYFYFYGREKDLIKQSGFCLYPNEIEEYLQKSSMVELALVVLDYDRFEQEVAHLIVKLKGNTSKSSFEKWISNNIEKDYRPNKISYTESFVFTDNGKLDKKAMLSFFEEVK